MEWKEKYLIGIKEIDEQHKKLFEASELLSYTTNINEIKNLLLFFNEYIDFHFTTEENLMRKYNYVCFEEHKKSHEDLKEKMVGYIELYFLGNYSFLEELQEVLIDWVSNHILEEDKKYMEFFKEKAVLF